MSNNIYKKLANAQGKFVKKDDKKNGMHFNPLSHDAVQKVSTKALSDEGLYSVCSYKNFFIQDGFVCTTCTMKIVDTETKDSIEIETHAIAKADKYGSGNAMSYARKYAFLNALNLRTGLEDDIEEAKDMEDGFPAEPLLIETNEKEEKNNIDKIYIAGALEKIKNNKDKKNSSVLRSDIESLKTRINQSMGWDAFTKTDQFKTFNALRNQITKQRRS
tara:strand:+ start:47 stop:700 length:654 start_codon:yes stop_codon:yes gene_type:complete